MPRHLRSLARPLLLVTLALSLPACLERRQTGQLNPDGSGKMTLDTYVTPPPQEPGSPSQPDALDIAKSIATNMVQDSTGVDVWSNLVVEKTADGRAHVVGTAYFPDINKLGLDNRFTYAWARDDKGAYTLTLKPPANNTAAMTPVGGEKLSDAQVAQVIAQGKAEYAQRKPWLQTNLQFLKVDATLLLPGEVTSTTILTQSGQNAVELTFDGRQILDAFDTLMADDKTLAASIRAGKQPDADMGYLVEAMFHHKGPIQATVTGPVKPQFDYKAAVAAAKAAAPAMYQRLGIDPNARPSPMPGTIAPMPVPQTPSPQH
ncbi:MAG TPA: hypothetical protein VHQ47_07255 [Phycisphaerae bacterium]|nr:hypothetical protein [Phycisphaerae bacterium]